MNIREMLAPEVLLAHRRPANRRDETWYTIRNLDDRTVIDLYDVIGEWGIDASQFVRELRAVNSSTIELHINSPGGLIHDGLSIYNALIDHPARVEAIVDGLAASAASWILQAADHRTMNRHTELMIHDGMGLTFGNEADHLESAALLGMVSDNIASIYAERAGGSVRDWRTAMRAETWYSAQEAVAVGLADDVRGDDDAASNTHTRTQLTTARARALRKDNR